MKKQFKLLLLAVTVVVLLAMTMLVTSATAEIHDAEGNKLGDSYETLAKAVEALPNVEGAATIKLTADETLAAGITIDQDIVIDGNGKALTFSDLTNVDTSGDGTAESYGVAITVKADVTVLNLTVSAANDSAFYVTTGGKLVLGEKDAANAFQVTSKYAAVLLGGTDAEAIIWGGEYKSTNTDVAGAAGTLTTLNDGGSGAKLTVHNGTFTGERRTVMLLQHGTVATLNNGTYYSLAKGQGSNINSYLVQAGIDGKADVLVSLTVNGGRYYADGHGKTTDTFTTAGYDIVIYNGGTFTMTGGFVTFYSAKAYNESNFDADQSRASGYLAACVYLKTARPVQITGGTIWNGSSNRAIQLPTGIKHDVELGGTLAVYGSSGVQMQSTVADSKLSITGGSYAPNPGQANTTLLNLSGSCAAATITGGTFNLSDGATLMTKGTSTPAPTFTVSDDGTSRPTFHLTLDSLDEFDFETFKECDFVLHSAGNVDISPFDNGVLNTSFNGTFNNTFEQFRAIVNAALENKFCQEVLNSYDPETGEYTNLTWIVSQEMLENLGLDPDVYRQQLTIDIKDFSGITVSSGEVDLTFTDFPDAIDYQFATVNGGKLTLNGITTTTSATFATVNGGELVLNNCSVSSSASRMVTVTADGCTLRVNGGTYTNNSSYIFTMGSNTYYNANDYTDHYPNTYLYLTGVTMYQTGGYSVVAYGGTAYIDNCYITFDKDIERGGINYTATTYKTNTGINAIWTGATYMQVKDSTVYSGSGSAAFTNIANDTGVLDIINCEIAGYRALYATRGITNIYSGKFHTNPGHVNHQLITINGDGAELNIYGGEFTVQANLSGTDTAVGMFYFTAKGTVNVYGGTFTSESIVTGVALVNMKAAGTLNVVAKGSTYKDYAGVDQTSVGANLIRNGEGPIFWNQAGTITVGTGNTLKVTAGASVLTAKEGTTFTISGATVYVEGGGVMPDDVALWENTTFMVAGAASVELKPGSYTITDEAAALAYANAVLTEKWASNQFIKPGVNLFANIDSYVPFIVKEGVTLTFSGANFAYDYELFVLEGGTVVFDSGNYTANGASLATVESGVLTINNGNFTATNTMFIVKAGGDVTVYDGTFNKIEDGVTADSIFQMKGGKLLIKNGSFTIENGGSVVYVDGGTTNYITVEGGTFKKNNNADIRLENLDHKDSDTYSNGSIFYFNGTGVEGKLYIEGGTYTSVGFVRIYSTCTEDGTYTANSIASTTKGVKVYVTGDDITFNGNADLGVHEDNRYIFQIARPGAHLIEITGDITVNATEYQVIFQANASSCAMGSTFNIHGGTYDGGNAWIMNNKAGVTFSIQNATFKDTANKATATSLISMISGTLTGVVGSELLIGEGAVLLGNDHCRLINFNTNQTMKVTGGMFIAPYQLFEDNGTDSSLTLNGGTFICTGKDTNIFRITFVTINKVVVVTNTSTVKGVELNDYAPEIMYAGTTYKVWVKTAATDAEKAPVMEGGAGLYVSTENMETSGIRFNTTIAGSVIKALTDAGYKIDGYGTVIAPADYVALAGEFTMDALSKLTFEGDKYVDIPAVNTLVNTTDAEGNGTVSFSGALINLKSNTRAYAGVSYIKATKDDETVYFYGAYDSTVNARTAEQIADAMIAAEEEYAMLSDLAKAIVDEYAAGVVTPKNN